MRDIHCGDCMVTALIDPDSMGLDSELPLDLDERAAVTACVRAGLITAEVSRDGALPARAVRASDVPSAEFP